MHEAEVDAAAASEWQAAAERLRAELEPALRRELETSIRRELAAEQVLPYALCGNY